MMQRPVSGGSGGPVLAQALQSLSAREQIALLWRATRHLSRRERIEVWRVAGVSVLRDRLLPMIVHVLLKHILAGVLWWIVYVIAAVLALLVLAWVEQLNPNAVGPVLTALLAFFCGFVLFALVDFVSTLISFFGKTCSRQARDELLVRLNTYEPGERLALLRVVSLSLATKIPGESLLDTLITGLVLFVASALLIVIALLGSDLLPGLSHFPWILLVAGVAFLLGLLGPGTIQHRLRLHSARSYSPRPVQAETTGESSM